MKKRKISQDFSHKSCGQLFKDLIRISSGCLTSESGRQGTHPELSVGVIHLMWLNYTMGCLMANGSEGFHWEVAGMLEHLKKCHLNR